MSETLVASFEWSGGKTNCVGSVTESSAMEGYCWVERDVKISNGTGGGFGRLGVLSKVL